MNEYLIHASGQRLSNESRDLIHVLIRLPRVQDSSKTTHLRIGSILKLLEPVIHHSTLPRVINGIRRRHGRVKEPFVCSSTMSSGSLQWHLDDGIHRNWRWWRVWEILLERSICWDDYVVRYQSYWKSYQCAVEQMSTAHLLSRLFSNSFLLSFFTLVASSLLICVIYSCLALHKIIKVNVFVMFIAWRICRVRDR